MLRLGRLAGLMHGWLLFSLVLALIGTDALVPAAAAAQATSIVNPSVVAISPTFGSPGGGNIVTITATNINVPTAVRFGGTLAHVTRVTQVGPITRIDVQSPPGSGVVDVTVSSPAGTSATGEQDEYSYSPEIASITPDAGPARSQVIINGKNFDGPHGPLVTGVNFGTTPATHFLLDHQASGEGNACGAGIANGTPCVVADVPPGSGVVDVTLTGPAGTSDIGPQDQYSYAPEISAIEPVAGPPDTQVTILGQGFMNARGPLVTAVNFGTAPALQSRGTARQIGWRLGC